MTNAQQNLIYWFAIYVAIHGAVLATQGLMCSLARVASRGQSKKDNAGQSGNDTETTSLTNNSIDALVRKRSRMHGNNQEWVPFMCIMLYALILCEVAPWAWHVLAWGFLANRLMYWGAMSNDSFFYARFIGATLNYLFYFITAFACLGYGISKL